MGGIHSLDCHHMNDLIKISHNGLMLKGDHKGWYLRVEYDEKHTGGYFIHYFESLSSNSTGYDDWVSNLSDLESYFIEAQMEIKWLDND